MHRVGHGHCCPIPPSEPCVIVSHHPAQASIKVPTVGVPANKVCFTILKDSQHSFHQKGAPAQGRHLLSLLKLILSMFS